ncbi:SWIM zinc finger family protein [Synechococcus sp. PCC 6312]|uniref:SWIM zinc finger family protein n=1 Tax=Synechococcus sp. (strain ATCC 27167 / PCC 6312) TaxID=195253 RepID=UPI00029F40C6|nr:SWIM zinc finger family protein [Synechococcus sp. PCC 6312]AFY61858.1 SWIM zinc finger-containing protein [Synechococcus sp. PCC 6312]
MSLIYNYQNASRILGVAPENIEKVEEWFKTVWVKVKDQSPILISKKKFAEMFVEYRQQGSHSLKPVKLSEHRYGVRNATNPHIAYQVLLNGPSVECTCPDYEKQKKVWKKGCCKHIYSVIRAIGFNSLKDYEQSFSLNVIKEENPCVH